MVHFRSAKMNVSLRNKACIVTKKQLYVYSCSFPRFPQFYRSKDANMQTWSFLYGDVSVMANVFL